MILDMDGEAFVLGIEAGSPCHGPTLEDAIHLQTKIIVQPGGGLFLDEVGKTPRAGDPLARRLARLGEVALGAIGFELEAEVAFAPHCTGCPCHSLRECAMR